MPTSDDIIRIARLFLFVREAGQNQGMRVNAIQKWSGGFAGDPWCCYWATMVLDLAFAGAMPAPLQRTGSCQRLYEWAKLAGWVTETPAKGDLFLYVNEGGHAHHVGIVTAVDGTTVVGIAGNTSADGRSDNGDRVAERAVPLANVFIAYPRG